MWNGRFFERVSLQSMGLRVQMGHSDGSLCSDPTFGSAKFTVVHTNGIHRVTVDYCGCPHGIAHEHWSQLMLSEWYPATPLMPKTAFTFRVLELFQMVNFEGKTTAYNFYSTLERITDNTGCSKIKVCLSASLFIVSHYVIDEVSILPSRNPTVA